MVVTSVRIQSNFPITTFVITTTSLYRQYVSDGGFRSVSSRLSPVSPNKEKSYLGAQVHAYVYGCTDRFQTALLLFIYYYYS